MANDDTTTADPIKKKPRTWKKVKGLKGIYIKIATGKFRVKWTNAKGEPKQETFAADTPVKSLVDFRDRQYLIAKTEKQTIVAATGSFVRDIASFLKIRIKTHPDNIGSDRSHLKTWIKPFGRFSRHAIDRKMVQAVIDNWTDQFSRAELKHRVNILRQLFKKLDPDAVITPCHGVTFPAVIATEPTGIPGGDKLIANVAVALEVREDKGRLRTGKTRARYMVQATCGKRPCQIQRTLPEHVDFTNRIWTVTAAKGGKGGRMFLNDEQFAAWELFRDADAWGKFSLDSYRKTLRRNGFPVGVDPYKMRHQTAQYMDDRDVSLEAIAGELGHGNNTATTSRFYVGSKHKLKHSKKVGEAIDGRFDKKAFAPRKPKKYDKKKTAA